MLRENSDLFFQNSPIFIVKTSIDGRITMMNDSLLRALDYPRDEVIGEILADRFLKKEDRDRFWEGLRKSMESGGVLMVDISLRTNSGGDLPVQWQIQPELREDGTVDFLFGVGIDLAACREMDRKLLESEGRYRGLFQKTHLPMFIIDPTDGSILDANPAACQFYGYALERIVAMKITEINTLDPATVRVELARAETGEKNRFNFKHRLADGSIRDVEVFSCGITVSGQPFLYSVVYDVTERKRMEEELMREREEQLLLFDSIPAMIFYKNRRNRFIRVNRAFAEFYGLSKKEIEGFTMENLFPGIAEESYQSDLSVMENGKPRRGILDMVDTRFGPKWIQTDKLPFRDESGNIIGIVGFSADITEPKKAGEAIQALVESASQEGGRNYFDHIANRICDWLGADYALVGKILTGGRIQVLSMNDAGRLMVGKEMDYQNTPLVPAIEQGYLFISENVDQRFPAVGNILQVQTEGFVGTVIRGRGGAAAGVICVFSRRKLLLPKRAAEVLRIFASKASLELERIRSEAALRESEERYRSLVETSPDAIAMTDLEGNIITANHRFAELLGLKIPEEAVSSKNKALNYLSLADRVRAGRIIKNLLSGKHSRVSDEFTIIRLDGTPFPAEISLSLIRHEQGQPRAFISIIRDITSRKKAEAHLHEEHARLESRLRNERMISEVAALINSADTLDVVLMRIAALFVESIPASRIYLFLFDPDAEQMVFNQRWIDPSGLDTAGDDSFCSFLDTPQIISRLRARESIVLNTFSDFDKRVRAALRSMGILSLTAFPLGTDEMLRGAILFCSGTKGEGKTEEHTLYRIVANMISNAFERDDNFQARIEAERRHAEAVKMAERSSRLASIGTLAAGISHEINQPLTALKVKVDSILYWQEMNIALPPEDLAQDLRFISQQTERIDDIIKHMHALARQEKKGLPSEINFNLIIEEVFSLLRERISARGIRLALNLDDALPPVRGYKTLVHQVVINLLMNAVDALNASPSSGKEIIVRTGAREGNCFLEVLDNGPGVPEGILNRLFDPFFTTKVGSEGMGLGLSICHNIVTDLGGTISAENRPEGGARFIVSIPLSSEPGRER